VLADWVQVSLDERRFSCSVGVVSAAEATTDMATMSTADREMFNRYLDQEVNDRKTVLELLTDLSFAASLKSRV
jgi:hypothetical protein